MRFSPVWRWKPELFGAFHKDALSVLPLCLHSAQLIPQAIWAPFPCPGSLAGKSLPTE